MIARFTLVATAVLLAAACGGNSPASSGRATGPTGVTGKVRISPGVNTCKPGASCSRPAVGVTLAFSLSGHIVVTTRTGKDGGYRIGLPKGGRYTISVKGPRGASPTVKPATTTVQAGHFTHLDLTIDVGIR